MSGRAPTDAAVRAALKRHPAIRHALARLAPADRAAAAAAIERQVGSAVAARLGEGKER